MKNITFAQIRKKNTGYGTSRGRQSDALLPKIPSAPPHTLHCQKVVLSIGTYGRNRAAISRKINIFQNGQNVRVGYCHAHSKCPKLFSNSKI